MRADEAFISWLSAQPGVSISNSIQLYDYTASGQGRGLHALAPIKAGEELFCIPKTVVLSTANSSLLQRCPQAAIDFDKDAWLQLILTLFYEHSLARAGKSRWGAYLDLLPVASSFTTPMWYTDAELIQLQGCSMLARIGKEDANTLYQDKILPFLQQHIEHFNLELCTLEDFHRWGSCIMSYAFDLEDPEPVSHEDDPFDSDAEDVETEKVLCPLADMLNADTRHHNANLVLGKETLTMVANQDIAPGQQIYNTYGHLPSADLLRRYGYVQEGENTEDTAEVRGDLVARLATHLTEGERDRRIDYLLQQEMDDVFEVDAAGNIPQEFLVFVEMLALSTADFTALQEREALSKGKTTPALQGQLRQILEARLAMFPTTTSEDEALLESGISGNMRNIVLVRLREKRILGKALAQVNEWRFKRTVEDASEDEVKRQRL